MTPIKIIHIGKCGGSTVSCILNKFNIKHENIHIIKPIFDDNYKYLILIRNPIDRIISAFNWRYKLVILNKMQENRFAENINDFNINKLYIHHIYEDINFYLGNFLQNIKKENIIGVVTQEDLNNDIKEIFNIYDDNIHNNTKSDKYISNIGYNLLKQYLYKDYECIHKLYSMGLLSDKQYNILSK